MTDVFSPVLALSLSCNATLSGERTFSPDSVALRYREGQNWTTDVLCSKPFTLYIKIGMISSYHQVLCLHRRKAEAQS